MNPRQRRGLILLLASVLGAVAVFVGLVNYTSDVRAQVGDLVPVVRLTKDVPAFTPVGPAASEVVRIPRKYAAATMVADLTAVSGEVPSAPLRQGSYLQQDMFEQPPDLQPGQRELAILIDAETGVAGKVRSGDFVDIYATFASSSGAQATPPQARIIVSRALVIAIGDLQQQSKGDTSGSFSRSQLVPVTFALTVRDSLVLAYAESFAAKVRLARISPTDRAEVAPQDRQLSGDVLAQQAAAATAPVPAPTGARK